MTYIVLFYGSMISFSFSFKILNTRVRLMVKKRTLSLLNNFQIVKKNNQLLYKLLMLVSCLSNLPYTSTSQSSLQALLLYPPGYGRLVLLLQQITYRPCTRQVILMGFGTVALVKLVSLKHKIPFSLIVVFDMKTENPTNLSV